MNNSPTLTDINGQVFDALTGQPVGREEGAPTSVNPRASAGTEAREQEFSSPLDAVAGVTRQSSWGLATGLFHLPDMAVKGFGRALGMDPQNVTTLTDIYKTANRMIGGAPDVAPKNMTERFARAISEGVGGGAPFTGVVAWAAASRPLIQPAMRLAADGKAVVNTGTILKGVANDVIEFAQKNPRAAFYTDAAFNGAYEALRQGVEETVDDTNPYKPILKDFLPMAAFTGIPLAASLSPTLRVGKWAAKKLGEADEHMKIADDVTKKVYDDLPSLLKMPGISLAPKYVLQRAEKRMVEALQGVHGNAELGIKGDPDAQLAINQLKEWMTDPRVANAGFVWDAAQSTMHGPMLSKHLAQMKTYTKGDLANAMERQNLNEMGFFNVLDSFAPEAQVGINDAMRTVLEDRQNLFKSLLREKQDLTEAELLSISDRLGPQNMENANAEIRGALLASMEFSAAKQNQLLRDLGIKRDITLEGLPMATRDPETKVSTLPAAEISDYIQGLMKKYKVNDPSRTVPVPTVIKRLERWYNMRAKDKDIATQKFIDEYTRSNIEQQIKDLGWDMQEMMKPMPRRDKTGNVVGEDPSIFDQLLGEATSRIRQDMGLPLDRRAMKPAPVDKEGRIIIRNPPYRGMVGMRPGQPLDLSTSLVVNTKVLAEDVKREAAKYAVDMNAEEAMHYLNNAIQDRSYLFSRAQNTEIGGKTAGRLSGTSDIQRNIGNQIVKDIEEMVMKKLPEIDPKVAKNFPKIRQVMDDYQREFEQVAPLLMTKREIRGGQYQYTTPNEQISKAAFSNADNLRRLVSMLDSDVIPNEMGREYLHKASIDWLTSQKNVFTKEGTIDPAKMQAVLDKHPEIVEALPQSIRDNFKDEVKLAQDYINRMAQLEQRRVAVEDKRLQDYLEQAALPGADPNIYLHKAIQDPAYMQMLKTQVEHDPELLAALRRGVYDVVAQGARQGGALSVMLSRHGKSMEVLYGKNSPQLKDLHTLADIQRRATAYSEISGTLDKFQATDDQFKNTFGFGVPYLTTAWRAIEEGRQSATTGTIALLLRAATTYERGLYDKMFKLAMEDPEFAKRLTNLKTPEQGTEMRGMMEKRGISLLPYLLGKTATTTAQGVERDITMEGKQQVPVEGMDSGLPIVPRETARGMLDRVPRPLPPAPATRGMPENKPAFPAAPEPSQRGVKAPGGQAQSMYAAMFPNDPISALIQQRQAAIPPQGPPQ
jgi:hypothetical protein